MELARANRDSVPCLDLSPQRLHSLPFERGARLFGKLLQHAGHDLLWLHLDERSESLGIGPIPQLKACMARVALREAGALLQFCLFSERLIFDQNSCLPHAWI